LNTFNGGSGAPNPDARHARGTRGGSIDLRFLLQREGSGSGAGDLLPRCEHHALTSQPARRRRRTGPPRT
jgi:hypothetical protein